MGRRKKLPDIERLDGNPTKRVIEESGIEALGEPFIPEHLSDDARGCIECIKASMPSTVYSALDSFILSAFATSWALHKLAAHKINDPAFEHVITVGDNGAEAQSPWLAILNKQAMLMASLGDRLGLDPKSRAALKLPGAKQRKSKFAGLIGQTGLSRSLSS
ncbi:P27 family phage terminase small subunit [uncultured Bradyrhizobium sp.]|uniref:P27 family phage terminase small subunit n=1 Tax=uncultured Bradyrhizobium sp. TaxID=199684 RepID=UPI0035C951DD